MSRSHAQGLRAVPSVDLVALADVSASNVQAAGQAFGVDHLYRDYREMLAREQLDLLTVCTQAPLHAPS